MQKTSLIYCYSNKFNIGNQYFEIFPIIRSFSILILNTGYFCIWSFILPVTDRFIMQFLYLENNMVFNHFQQFWKYKVLSSAQFVAFVTKGNNSNHSFRFNVAIVSRIILSRFFFCLRVIAGSEAECSFSCFEHLLF